MRITNMLWGIVLVVMGVVLGFNALEITNIDIFFKGWWTLFIIVPSFIGLFGDKDKIGNLVGLLIGGGLFLACRGLIRFDLIGKLIVPIILVVIGLSMIFRDEVHGKIRKEIRRLSKEDKEVKEYCATFAKQMLQFSKEEFSGCILNAIFGGVSCDLRESLIKENSIIQASAIFGGIVIYVPEEVNVKVVSTPIFGGVSVTKKNSKEAKKTIYINATCVFGGVEIK